MQAIPLLACGGALVAVALLWKDHSTPPAMPGEVEAIVSEVTSPGAGMLTQLHVSRFEEVEAGEVIAQVITTPPEVLHASLAVLKAEIELTRLGWIDPLLDQQRNALQLESMKLDWLEKAATLAIRRIELLQAEREHDRVRRLFDTSFVSEEEYERAQNRVSVLNETVAQEAAVAEKMERALEGLRIQRPEEDFAPAALKATLAMQKERLALSEAELRPVSLVAPMSGTVMLLHRQNGQHVTEGEPILTIQSSRVARIVAYLRQPIQVEPEVGMQVEIASRSWTKQRALSEILFVGPQIEPLGPAFLRPSRQVHQSGLPVVIAVPRDLKLRPGELVDVVLQP